MSKKIGSNKEESSVNKESIPDMKIEISEV